MTNSALPMSSSFISTVEDPTPKLEIPIDTPPDITKKSSKRYILILAIFLAITAVGYTSLNLINSTRQKRIASTDSNSPSDLIAEISPTESYPIPDNQQPMPTTTTTTTSPTSENPPGNTYTPPSYNSPSYTSLQTPSPTPTTSALPDSSPTTPTPSPTQEPNNSPDATPTPSPTTSALPDSSPTTSVLPDSSTDPDGENTLLPGDANEDGLVDELDFAIWQSHYLQTTALGHREADFNQDSTVDGKDYTIWFNNYTG